MSISEEPPFDRLHQGLRFQIRQSAMGPDASDLDLSPKSEWFFSKRYDVH